MDRVIIFLLNGAARVSVSTVPPDDIEVRGDRLTFKSPSRDGNDVCVSSL
ncbi:MAG: hypothetical protein AAGH42_10635 [Pseudomonadota bacterium]